jgi:hypothetical protein
VNRCTHRATVSPIPQRNGAVLRLAILKIAYATALFLRDGDEVLELPEFHDSSPRLLKGISFFCWTA